MLALCCDPATDNNALAGRDLCLALKEAHPTFRAVTSDREYTPSRAFVRDLHSHGIDTIMDLKRLEAQKLHEVTVGQRDEVLYQSCGDFFPLCLPDKYKTLPDPKTNSPEEILDWFDDRAPWRYVPNGPPDTNGTRQFLCSQCAGHLRFAANTRMGKHRRGPHPGLSLGPPFEQEWCCSGSISIAVEDLDKWQPVPWATRAHQALYAAGRGRIENTNNIAKQDVGISRKSCRAPGPLARNMAVLALAVASNVSFADEDPLADPPTDRMPQAELSLFCVLPALSNTPGDRTDVHTGQPPRAPP